MGDLMIKDSADLAAAEAGFSVIFNNAFTSALSQQALVAMELPSSGPAENYEWLGDLPTVREWIGERQIRTLAAKHMAVTNKKYEASVGLKRTDIEDDNLGIIRPKLAMLGQRFAQKLDSLVFGHLTGAAWTDNAYDGVPLFSTAHPREDGLSDQANTAAGIALAATPFEAAYDRMLSRTDEYGEPLGIVPTHLIVGPSNRAAAEAILKAKLEGGGDSNLNYGRVELMVVPWITGTKWFVASLSGAIKPVLLQMRVRPQLESQTTAATDAVFMRDEYRYGGRMRCAVASALWQVIDGNAGA